MDELDENLLYELRTLVAQVQRGEIIQAVAAKIAWTLIWIGPNFLRVGNEQLEAERRLIP